MTTQATDTATGWKVWARSDRRSPWRMILEAGTEDEALNAALDLHLREDLAVLPSPADPNVTLPTAK
jgi:hypothetical protein